MRSPSSSCKGRLPSSSPTGQGGSETRQSQASLQVPQLPSRLSSSTLEPHPPQAWPHPRPASGRLSPLPRGAFSSDFRLEIHRVQLSRSRRHFPETSAFHSHPSHGPSSIPMSIPALLELSGRCLSMHYPSLVKQS